jgi:predicted permease
VGLVLLIACGNIANLLLARATARRHEMSLRQALGASRSRLTRQLLAESGLLSVAGAALGGLLALWGSRLLVTLISTQSRTVALELGFDWRLLAFTAAVAIGTALLFGTAPALKAASAEPIEAIKDQGRGSAADGKTRLAGGLVVAQVALSLVLVIGAGLFVRTFSSLATVDLGFEKHGLLVVNVNADRAGVKPEGRLLLYQQIRDAAAAVPGVGTAALSYVAPMSGSRWNDRVEVIDGIQLEERQRSTHLNFISPEWLATMGTAVRAGRNFDPADITTGRKVVLANEAFVERFIGEGSGVGRIVRQEERPGRERQLFEIVGVVEDAVYHTLREEAPPTLYYPIGQGADVGTSVVLTVRSRSGSPARLTHPVSAALVGVNPDLTVSFRVMASQVAAVLTQERLVAVLSAFFGSLALLLAGLGLYGVTSYSVNRRRTEIGIRMALGAAPARVQGLVLRRVAGQVGLGLVLGVVVSLWLAQFVKSLLYGLAPRDPVTTVGAALVLVAVGAAAGWIPARRAARVDPATVLREG